MKALRYALLVAGLLVCSLRPSAAQVFDWAKLARGTSRSVTNGTAGATDAAGNTYSIISFRDTLRVGSQALLATAGSSVVVKYDSTGQVQWTRQLRNISLQNGLVVDPANGGIFVLGQASSGATWGGVPVAVSPAGSFYAKCSATGTLQWTNALPLLSGAYRSQSPSGLGGALAADGLGNCYVMGNVRGLTSFGGLALDTTMTLLFQANPGGTLQWTRTFHTVGNAGTASRTRLQNVDLAAKPGGGCAVMGYFSRSLYFSASGTAPVLAPATTVGSFQDSFMGSVDAAGSLLWAQPAPARNTSSPTGGAFFGIAADAANNCYGTGRFGNGGFGLVKYNATGTLQWLTASAAPAAGQTNGGLGEHVAVDQAGNVTAVVGTSPQATGAAGSPIIIGSLILRAPNNLVRFNAQGQPQWAIADAWRGFIVGGTTRLAPYLEPVSLGLDGRGNLYYTANVVAGIDTLAPQPPVIALGARTLVGRGLMITRVGTANNTVSGALYLDRNGNGIFDAGDSTFPQNLVVQNVQAGSSAFSTIETDGRYRLFVGSGAYTVAAPVAPVHYALSQPTAAGYTGSFNGFAGVDSVRHFGYRPIPNQADVRVTLTPYGAARGGLITRYRLTVENVGTTTTPSGTATLTFDSHFLYISSTPGGSRAGQVVTWSYAALAPFARFEYDILLSLPTNVMMGTALLSTAGAPLIGDVVPADNTATAAQTVVASYDPNAIDVNYQRITPAQVAAGQVLEYTIHFQNLGTAEAYNVVLNDALDFRRLDLLNLRWIGQSHNCMWSITSNGQLTVRFLNINLPSRNVDVIRSQGYVRFQVPARTTLAVGEVIPNQAGIVFDYNEPVLTNTATTTVFLATAALARHDALAWTTYPNPATDALTVALDLPTTGPVRVELLDGLGRPVRQQSFVAPAGALRQTLDLRGLPAGVYLLRLTPPTGPASSRQVVRE